MKSNCGIGKLIIVFLDFPPQHWPDQENVLSNKLPNNELKLSGQTILGSKAIKYFFILVLLFNSSLKIFLEEVSPLKKLKSIKFREKDLRLNQIPTTLMTISNH